jgi:triacylglycerol esterase/lipase EstA (alpha/beta hydrolase family)
LLRAVLLVRALSDGARAWRLLRAGQRRCTPAGTPVPARPDERRIVVLVGGYGSSGGHADVLDVDTASLGYDDADRVQFSYAGGRVPGVGELDGVPVRSYDATTSMGDLAEAGTRLRSLLADIRAAHPAVPIDVIAHSQGGLVARAALGGSVPTPRASSTLVTLGSPHHGAPLAALADGWAPATATVCSTTASA